MMTMLTSSIADIGFLDASVVAVLGYGVVFLGLIFLMIVVMIMGKAFTAAEKKAVASEPAPQEAPAAPAPEAPGSAGELKLHNVDPRTAAMLMAIVADKLGKPLNELRFISIKEVE